MALFGTPRAFVGLDIGTASLKVVELVDRRRRIEVATYAQADMPNLLIDPTQDPAVAIAQVAGVIGRLLEQARVSADAVVAALPSSVVFSTVLQLPDLPDKDMEGAVTFAARDVVPADLDDMILGWSRVGAVPHMAGEKPDATAAVVRKGSEQTLHPVFVTAAPKDVVMRYTEALRQAKLDLQALEVETFPLVRSLMAGPQDSGMIVDIGASVTTFHLIDAGTPRVSHTIDFGGNDLTAALATALGVSSEEAENLKFQHGLQEEASVDVARILGGVVGRLPNEAVRLLTLYQHQSQRALHKTILIGAGAKLKGLVPLWSRVVGHPTAIGDPWRGLSYPAELEGRAQELAPTFAVAVGLAQRGLLTNS